MKYKDWLFDWLENYVKPSSKIRTYQRYEKICSLHIIDKLGETEISELSIMDLQKFVTDCLTAGNRKNGKGLSVNFVNSIISVLQNSLKTAQLIGLISTYDGDKIKRPKMQEKQVECFSLLEQKQIETAVLSSKKDKLFGIVLCLYTGLRIGELLALEWSDIDLEKKIIAVSKNCYDGNKDGVYCRIIDTPKTSSSNRIIPIPKQIVPLLKDLKKKSKSDFIIADGTKPVFVRSYQRTFELLLKKLDIQHKGFHALRHTFATRALECGMDVKTLSEILGHKNATITLNRYVHSLMEHKQEMMNRLGKML